MTTSNREAQYWRKNLLQFHFVATNTPSCSEINSTRMLW
jgi:hypothetical protein